MWKKDKDNIEIVVCNAEYNKRVSKTRTIYSDDGKTPLEMWGYKCERCLTQNEDPYDADAVKELFDYFYMSGSILCSNCREEMEKFKNNAYKFRAVFKYEHNLGEMVEDIEDVYPNINAIYKKIDEMENELLSRAASMGFRVTEKRYYITYIPYAERKK